MILLIDKALITDSNILISKKYSLHKKYSTYKVLFYLFRSKFKKNCYYQKKIFKNIMHKQDAIYLDQFCPKISNKNWRESLNKLTKFKCIYCGKPSESLDHLHPMSKGGTSSTSNCVPCCLSCNGKKSDSEVLSWYRKQNFYDPRRAMAIRAWLNDDLKLASVLLNYLN